MFQTVGDEKVSVKTLPPMPGFWSGVACLVGKTRGVGVCDKGNQMIVGVGDVGVSVTGTKSCI